MDSSWKNVFILLAACAVIFTLLTLIEVYMDKKLREYYLKKYKRLQQEEKELLRQLHDRDWK